MLNLGPMWGLDIGDAAIKAVKLKRVGEQLVMLDFQVVRYADVTGVPGSHRDEAVGPALERLRASAMGNDKCFVSIAPQNVFSRFISLPPVDKRRVPEIVLYEAKQQIPFNLDEVVWAYETVRKDFVPGEEIEIGLFAIKREVIEAYLAQLAPIRRQIQGIQVGPLALYNFVRYEMTIEQPTVVMDIGAQATDLLVLDGDKFWLRNLPLAGNAFTSVLEKRLNIPRAEAEKLKLGIPDSRHRRKLLEVLRAPMRDLVAEVQRSIGYYKSLAQEVKFDQILILGDGYRLCGLDRFIADQLQYRINVVQKLDKIPFQGTPERAAELSQAISTLGPAIGLAVQGLERSRARINFLPDEFVVQRELQTKRFSGLIAAGLVWGIVGCLWLQQSHAFSAITQMEGAGQDTLTQVRALKQKLDSARSQQPQGEIDRFGRIGRHRDYYARIIGALAGALPRDAQLETPFTFAVGGGAQSGQEFGGRDMPGRGAMPGMPDRGFDRGGMPGMPGRGFERGAQPSESGGPEPLTIGPNDIIVTFAVSVADVEKEFLLDTLPKYIKRATIYSQALPVVKGVEVSGITIGQVAGLAEEGGAPRTALNASVMVVLLPPEEVDAALAQHMEKLAQEAAARQTESASNTGTSAGGAAPSAPAPN